MLMHVNADSLNLRSEPQIKKDNVIEALPFGHPVEVTGDASKAGWKTVRTTIKGKNLEGVVSASLLRAPLSAQKEALLAAGVVQWERFNRGAGKESVAPFDRFVGEMWANIGQHLTGKDTEVPWSAACISFMVTNAGYTRFKKGSSHSIYIHDAIKQRQDGNTNRDYWGFRITEHKPTFGDLVCRKRSSANITFDLAASTDEFQSHTDIVVAVGKDYVDGVGGNVSNSVSITRYKLKPDGMLDPNGGKVFAVLKNNN